MHLITKSNKEYLLVNNKEETLGSLVYTTTSYKEATVIIAKNFFNIKSKHVLLDTVSYKNENIQIVTSKTGLSNSVVLNLLELNKQYYFKKTGLWKLRFTLTNENGEELFALLPIISWTKKTHDYSIQLNDEFLQEITPMLVLHSLHYANCILTMMNGLVTIT